MIVCEVDGRGSGGRGEDHLLALRRAVGKVDIQDIVQTVRLGIEEQKFQLVDGEGSLVIPFSVGNLFCHAFFRYIFSAHFERDGGGAVKDTVTRHFFQFIN